MPDLSHYDFAGFATYTDWGDPPLFVKLVIDKLPMQKGKPAFLFNTCAALSGKTLKTLKTWVNQKGFKVVSAFTLKAPESYPPLVIKGLTGKNNPSERDMIRLINFINELSSFFSSSGHRGLGDLKDTNVKIGIINTLSPRYSRNKSKLQMGNKYVDQGLCTQCGVCFRGCPNEAISINSGVNFDEDKCYGCWSCFNHCPQKAIYTEKIKGIGQYSILENYSQKLMS